MKSFFTAIVNGLECVKCGMILNNTSIFLHVKEKECDNKIMKNMEELAKVARGFREATSMNIERLSHAIEDATNSRLVAVSKEKERLKLLEETQKKEKEIEKKKLKALLWERVRERQRELIREKTEKKEREKKEKEELERKEKCSICHEDLDQNIDSPCKHGHFFHFECIQNLKTHNQKKCPVCRTSIAKFLETFVLKNEVEKE